MPPKKQLMKEAGQSSLKAWAFKAKKGQETDNPSENVTEPMPSTSTTENERPGWGNSGTKYELSWIQNATDMLHHIRQKVIDQWCWYNKMIGPALSKGKLQK